VNTPDLVYALEKALASKGDDWGKLALHVTDLAVAIEGEDGKCKRQLWLRLNGAAEQPATLGKQLMFDHSHGIHERIVPMLKEGLKGTGWVLEHVELSLKGLLPEGVDSGRVDTVLRGPNHEVIILDFKSVRGNAWQYLEQPKPAHVLQVQTYAEAYGADGAMILYIDREGQNGVKAFTVERDDEKVFHAVQVAAAIKSDVIGPERCKPVVKIRTNKGPDAVYLESGWRCDYCEFRDVSCEGSLLPHLRDLGVVAKRAADGSLTSNGNSEAFGIVSVLLNPPEAV